MWFIEALLGWNTVETFLTQRNTRRTANAVARQNEMLFDAMTAEQQQRVLVAQAERDRLAALASARKRVVQRRWVLAFLVLYGLWQLL